MRWVWEKLPWCQKRQFEILRSSARRCVCSEPLREFSLKLGQPHHRSHLRQDEVAALVGSRLAPRLGVPFVVSPSFPYCCFGVPPSLVVVECPLGACQEGLEAFGRASYSLEVALSVLLVLQQRRLQTR